MEAEEGKKRSREDMEKEATKVHQFKKEKVDLEFKDTRKFYSTSSFLGEKSECDRRIGKFNNFVKSMILKRCLRNGDVVLDVGGGQGQDLEKYKNSGIKELLLIDQSSEAIKEARKRFREGFQKKRYQFNGYFLPCVNAFDSAIMENLLKDYAYWSSPNVDKNWHGNFDVVSSQLAFHYAFINEHSIRSALKIVASALRKDGLFIGTIPNGEFISKMLIQQGKKEYVSESKKFRLKITDDTPSGERCQMTICDKSGPLYEPIVQRELFDKYAAEVGLEPYFPNIHFKDFNEIFTYYIDDSDNRQLSKKFFSDIYASNQTDSLHETVKEQHNFYCAFSYRKK